MTSAVLVLCGDRCNCRWRLQRRTRAVLCANMAEVFSTAAVGYWGGPP